MSPTAVTQLQARELSRVATSLAALRTQKSSLGLNERDDFQLAHAQTDRFGQTHAHFQQLHQGVPVWGARAITHLNASGLSLPATTDGLRTGIRVGTQPVLDMAGAISLATIDVMPTGPFGTEPTAELIIYPETRRVNLAPDKPLKKQNAADFQEQVTGYRLAWHVHTELDNPKDGVVHTDFILDARTGEQLKKWKSLETVAAVGQGLSQYSGRVQINTWQRPDGTFELRDTTRTYGEGLRTFDVNHASERDSDPTLTAYLDDDNTWGDGQDYIPDGPTLDDNGQTAAVDAHFGLQMTWDYYQRIHGRFGVDDAGTPTYNRVHIDSYYDNAFWSDSCFCMSYGDGSFSVGNVFGGSKSVTSLDVTGHELSHGVMSRTADLIYSGESGGLNESNSDIFGTMTEFWVRNGRGDTIGNGDKGNWMIGEDLNPFFPFRYMFKPSYDGSSADAWSPDLEKLDVHFSSGPMNRAYYFLSQGADPLDVESDVNSEYLPAGMTGIGNDKAAAIWYRAITAYLYPSANYLAARTASLKAAQDLFGTQSAEYRAVENAFTAINVGYSAGTRDDKTPPSVSAGVSGRAPVLQLHATASDDVGVTRVDFYVDGARVATDTSMPYEGSLDITPFSNGTHQLVAVAFDKAGNTASSTPVTFNVAHTFAQLLKDPGFEAGGEGWEADPRGNINYPADGARTGVGFTWLNGYGDGTVHRDNLYQDVTIPASAQRTSLSFYLNLTTTETGPEVHDYVVVQVRDTSGAVLETLATWSNLDATLGWVQRSFDLSAYAGQTIRIYLEGYEDDVPETATSFKVDDFSLRVSEEYADTEAPAVTASAVVTDSQVGLFADVMDNGHVASVEFFVDGTSRGTSAPSFALALDAASLSNGVHTVVARAVDSAGNVGDSAPVTFYVDVHRQQLVLNPGFEELRGEDPADWAISTDMPGGVFAYPDARFAHAGTNFLLLWAYAGPHTSTVSQSVAIPADSTSAIYSFWLRIYSDAFFDGEVHHTLTARVRDASGAEKTLRTYSNLDVTDGEYLERRFDLSAYKGQTIQLVFEADMTEPMPRGADTEMFLDDVTLFTTSTPDTVKPALTASVDGSSGTLQLNATVSDNVWTSSLRFSVDGSGVAMRPDPKGRYAVPFDSSGLTNGTHTLTVDAVDTAGNTATVKVDFDTRNATTNDTSAPVVDSVTASGVFENYTLEATAHDDTRITHVEYYVDGAFVGQAWSAPFTVSYKATLLTEGAHTVKAVAYDEAGNFGEATTPLIFTAPYLTLSPARVVVAVGGSASFSASVENAADTSVSWAVKDGEPCGSVTNTGAYTASSKAGTCRVVAISNASKGTSATATVIVYTGDINGDGVVDGEDMGLVAQSYGSGSSEAGYSTAADLDADSAVNDNDVTLFVSQFGR